MSTKQRKEIQLQILAGSPFAQEIPPIYHMQAEVSIEFLPDPAHKAVSAQTKTNKKKNKPEDAQHKITGTLLAQLDADLAALSNDPLFAHDYINGTDASPYSLSWLNDAGALAPQPGFQSWEIAGLDTTDSEPNSSGYLGPESKTGIYADLLQSGGQSTSVILGALGVAAAAGGSGSKTESLNTGYYAKAAPTIVAITSSTANGAYGQSAQVEIRLTTSDDMTAGSSLVLTLATGGMGEKVILTRDSSNARLFKGIYVVQAGDNSSGLSVSNATLSNVVGAINPTDSAGTPLDMSLPFGANSLEGSKSIVIDTTPPTIVSITSGTGNGAYVLIHFES
jgi:hypothetical protein